MRKTLTIAVVICLLTYDAAAEPRDKDTSTEITQLLFGSCIKQQNPAPILNRIADAQPDLFVFLGDNIYGDTDDMQELRDKYAALGAMPGFKRLREQCPILATWDDHDYGRNDAGNDYEMRSESQKVFMDFWKEPGDSVRRKTPGVYDAKVFGPEGRRVQVILLDTRFFRSPLRKGQRRVGGPYYPDDDPKKTMLGEAQWKWLAKELHRPAELRILATGIQCVAESAGQETWSNLPRQRQALFDLIRLSKAQGVVIISGDRHWAELSVTDGEPPYPIYDLTSSSLNQMHPRGTPTTNRFRALPNTYHRENYGVIRIDWDRPGVQIQMQICDMEGTVRIGHSISLDQLKPKT